MALFLLEDMDFKDFWMKIWNAGVSVITRPTFSSLLYVIFCNIHVHVYAKILKYMVMLQSNRHVFIQYHNIFFCGSVHIKFNGILWEQNNYEITTCRSKFEIIY